MNEIRRYRAIVHVAREGRKPFRDKLMCEGHGKEDAIASAIVQAKKLWPNATGIIVGTMKWIRSKDAT